MKTTRDIFAPSVPMQGAKEIDLTKASVTMAVILEPAGGAKWDIKHTVFSRPRRERVIPVLVMRMEE